MKNCVFCWFIIEKRFTQVYNWIEKRISLGFCNETDYYQKLQAHMRWEDIASKLHLENKFSECNFRAICSCCKAAEPSDNNTFHCIIPKNQGAHYGSINHTKELPFRIRLT